MARKSALSRNIIPQRTIRRCAIYTRKSSEEGLEQEFNSLHAQREACESYVRSQRHEGWQLLPTLYDDGGISGGTLERPALQQLLTDIASNKVDLVVVYKVDRLTRSLADFAKIVEVFDQSGASFVSVTQQFNTATSIGRLTLNMLLSFAQFEREVTGERIRDKIAASKRKGMWMGGFTPLGYDAVDRKLVVNPEEAANVKLIFERYLALKSVSLLQQDLTERGICSKSRSRGLSAKFQGGQPLARGALYTMLQNRLYRGEICHQGQIYPGQHEAIIAPDLWDQVQELLAQNRVDREEGQRAAHPSLLTGLLFDRDGARLSPTHATKKGRRYRYYVSQSLQTGEASRAAAMRIPADDLESAVGNRIITLLLSPPELRQLLATNRDHPTEQLPQLLERAREIALQWPDLSQANRRQLLLKLIRRVTVAIDGLELLLCPHALWSHLSGAASAGASDVLPPAYVLSIPAKLRRTGIEMRLLIDAKDASQQPDETLIRLIARAERAKQTLITEGLSVVELAQRQSVTPSYMSRLLRLGFLAPDIVVAILRGQHPIGLSAEKLIRDSKLPLAWDEQRLRLGFAAQAA